MSGLVWSGLGREAYLHPSSSSKSSEKESRKGNHHYLLVRYRDWIIIHHTCMYSIEYSSGQQSAVSNQLSHSCLHLTHFSSLILVQSLVHLETDKPAQGAIIIG